MPIKDPILTAEKQKAWYLAHREEQLAKMKERHHLHKEEDLRQMRVYRLAHRQKLLEYNRAYYLAHKEKDNKRKSDAYYSNWEEAVKDNRKRRILARLEALAYYANACYPICVRCGEVDVRTLTLDHIGGNGYQERKQTGEGYVLAIHLRKLGWPEGYQTLCMNCQYRKRWENNEQPYERLRARGKLPRQKIP